MLAYGNTVLKVGTDWLDYLPPVRPYTIRLRYKMGTTPEFIKGTSVCIDTTRNIWDLTYNSTNWSWLIWEGGSSDPPSSIADLIEVLGANTTNITSMAHLFRYARSLTNVKLFDTSHVTDMNSMFTGCNSLSSIPLFDTSNVTDMGHTFQNCTTITSIPQFDTSKVTVMNDTFAFCYNVESGALALYQQASTQTNPPIDHPRTFFRCGENTESGRAELAQIPSDWGGTGE